MADVSGKFFSAVKVRTGVSPSSPGIIEGESVAPVIPEVTGFVPYTGATENVDLGEFGVDTGFVNLDTTPTGTPTTQGTLYWDDARSTAALIMNGTLQHIGQDTFFYVKNSTGSNIAKGVAVRFDGTDGASGHLKIAPFLADGTYPSTYFMGVTAEAIDNGEFGQVMHFGELEGIDTSDFDAGDLLYASTTSAGEFQTTAPIAPNNIVLIAAAVNSKNNGAIIVRPTYGSNINQDEGVKITSGTTGDLLQLQSGGLWENKTKAQVLGGTSSQFVKGDGSLDSNTYQVTSEKAQPNGYASLDGNGKVPLTQINDALLGNVNYQGLWNASTNTPTLANPPSSGTKGYYYIVSTAGTFAGISFEVGDWIISNGSAWEKVDNTDAVSSVFGRTGNVVAAIGDYTTAQVTESGNLYYTDGRARGALSFAAGSGAYNSSTGVITIPTNNNQITNGAGYITSAALGAYLPLAGGTMTGVITTPNGTFGIIVGDDSRLADRNIANTLFLEGVQNNDRGYINFSTTTGNALGAVNGGDLTWRGNSVWHGGNLINPVTGTGTTNYLPKFTGSTTIGNSQVFDDGTNVGIGNILPVKKLHISSSGEGLLRLERTGASARQWDINIKPNFVIGDNTAGQDRFFIDTLGNVGIGVTPDPSFKLDVNGTGRFSSELTINSGATRALRIDTNSGVQGISLSPNSIFGIDEPGVGNGRFIINTSGNVGIANNSPSFRLDVSGTGRYFQNSSSVGNATGITLQQSGTGDIAISYQLTGVREWLMGIDNSDSDSFKINHITGSGDFNNTGLSIATSGAATFSSSVTAGGGNSPTLGFQLTTTTGSSTPRITNDAINATVIRTGASGSPVVINNFANSSELVRFTDLGNVGINQNNPTGRLEVVPTNAGGNEGIFVNQLGSHQSTIRFKSAHSSSSDYRVGASITVGSAFEIYSIAAAASRLVITSGGNIGIGTASISNPENFQRVLNISSNNAALVLSNTNGTTKNWSLGAYEDGSYRIVDANSPRMTITSGGNVLIGASDNGNKLRVNGNVWVDGEVAVNAITCTSGNTNTYINPIGTLGIIYSGQGTSAVHQFLVNSGERFAVTNSGIRTISPSVGTNAVWKLGNVFTLSGATQNRIVRVEIDGTMYNLLAYA